MSGTDHNNRPSAAFCFGRDALCREIALAAVESGSVLLFGSRQSGKTSVLLRIRQLLAADLAGKSASTNIVPIYINMQMLAPEATPRDVLLLLARAAAQACEQSHVLSEAKAAYALEDLIVDLEKVIRGTSRSNTQLLFLIDEAKRVVGEKFPRGFQDNLFALIYGDHILAGQCCFVFAGAQDLYVFCEDDTSPIGSRAAFKIVRNLGMDATNEIVRACNSVPEDQIGTLAAEVFAISGGQAGLSVRLALSPADLQGERDAVLGKLRNKHSSLLRGWAMRMSSEGRAIQEWLLERGALRSEEVAARLEKLGFDRYRSDRVLEELEFSGVAIRVGNELKIANALYARFIREHLANEPGDAEERSAWAMIEAAELALRRAVRQKYSDRWAADADNRMRKVVGPDSWNTIVDNRSKATRSYRYTTHTPDGDVLHYAYFGQLTQLMLANQAWDMFRPMFRDKRELEDIVADVMPVRNDSAHFRSVPDRELVRCKLRCQDLLHLLRKGGFS